MISRAISVAFVGSLLVGAWAGCGDGGGGGGGLPSSGPYTPGGGTTPTGSSGGDASTGSGSGGAVASSSSGSSGGSSGSSGSSSGGAVPVEAGPPPLTLDTALAQFAACMSYSAFTSNGPNGVSAADVAKSQTTDYGDCNACHNQGDGGFWASYGTVQGQNMTQVMFNETQVFPYIAKWVSGTVDTNGNFKDLVPSNAIANQASLSSQCMAGTPCHPKFQLDPNVVTAINTFVTNTITAWHAGTCSQQSTDAGATDSGTD